MSEDVNNSQKLLGGEVSTSLLYGNFLSKYFLYRKYLSPDSVWVKNKLEYWLMEQAVLHWAWSNQHQHLNAQALGISRIFYMFNHELQSLCEPKRLGKMQQKILEDPYSAKAVMGNIYRKGFAAALFGKDYKQYLDQKKYQYKLDGKMKEASQIDSWLEDNYFDITNIFVTDIGLLMGEVIHEMESRSINRVLFPLIYILEPLFVFSTAFLLGVSFISIFIESTSNYKNSLLIAYLISILMIAMTLGVKRIIKLFWSQQGN